jgi:hypothetical protein
MYNLKNTKMTKWAVKLLIKMQEKFQALINKCRHEASQVELIRNYMNF